MTSPVLIVVNHPVLGAPEPAEPFTVVPYDQPIVDGMNLGITRGDGIFETVGIHDGRVHEVQPHLDRFARSAAMLDLPEPDKEAFRAAVELGIGLLDEGAQDAYCKYVLTRGIEGRASGAFGYAFLDANPDWTRQRTEGIAVVTLSRGYALDIQQTAPWLLQGAKTLSYAVNRSVLREAERRGAEDVVFTTTDGYALEGPTSSLLLRFGDRFVTPTPELGVLHGTGQQGSFAWLEQQGFTTEYRPVRVEELAEADALWMTNSQRLAAPIRRLDDVDRPVDRAFTDAMNIQLLNRRT